MGLIYADKKIDNQRKQADNLVPFCGLYNILSHIFCMQE